VDNTRLIPPATPLGNLVLSVIVGVVEVELLSTQKAHDGIEDSELSCSEGSNHDAPREETDSAEFLESGLASEADEAGGGASALVSSLLVDHGEEGIGGVRHHGGGHTSHHTGGEGDGEVGGLAAGLRGLSGGGVDRLSCLSLHSELGHGVGHLLEEDGSETGVEAGNTLGGQHTADTSGDSLGEGGVGDGLDADGLKRAQEQVGNELGHGGRGEVDGSSVFPGLSLSELLGEVHLEEFYSSELEPSLHKITSSSSTKTGSKGTSSFLGNNLAPSSEQTLSVLDGVELDACLHDIHGAQGSVGDRTADATSCGTLDVVHQVVLLLSVSGGIVMGHDALLLLVQRRAELVVY
jgi:hypothetical protein